MSKVALDKIAYVLVLAGALNWFSIVFLSKDLVDNLFGIGSDGAKYVKGLVGASAVYIVISMLYAKYK